MIIPKGKYVICDPCHALSDEDYAELISMQENLLNHTDLLFTKDKLFSYALFTAQGDGEYNPTLSQVQSETMKFLTDLCPVGVDSGMIAITSLELATELEQYEEPFIIIEVLTEIRVIDLYGDLSFGNIFFRTDHDIDFNSFDDDEFQIDCRDIYF